MCTALAEDFRSSGSVVPMGVVRQGVLQLLALDSQARQIAEEYGVTAGETFRREVAQRRDFAQSLPSDVRSDYIAVMTANARATAVRCCMPPETCAGRLSLCSQRLTARR